MRRSVVGMGLLLAGLMAAPQRARADLITFYGCAKDVPAACILVEMTGSPERGYGGIPVPNTVSAVPVKLPSGEFFTLYDSFSWSLPDGSCFGGDTSIYFHPGTCAARIPASMVITGHLDLYKPGFEAVLPYARASITLTATPEPASIVLAGTGLLFVVGNGLRRRRRPEALAR